MQNILEEGIALKFLEPELSLSNVECILVQYFGYIKYSVLFEIELLHARIYVNIFEHNNEFNIKMNIKTDMKMNLKPT